ncbi:hypothetical protein [Salinilacihabitans rarus]|uniref:hypothetical protein n=1 Tax=Salinilacihabitans rarus TaxID=2961596 RepID=UPI0020C88489|nr:hypothetical protein [Salinilacihabitans rarus]
MSEGERRAVALSPRAYGWLDRTTKLLGVALVGAGLEVGGGTAGGVILAVAGAAAALATVFVQRDDERDRSTDGDPTNE